MKKRLSHIRHFLCGLAIVNFILISENNNQTIAYCQEVDSIFVDKILFYSERGGHAEIYLINPDGTGEVRLTTNNLEDIVPDISPDGNQIVFASNRDGNYEIYKMKNDGTEVTRLTNTPAEEAYPFWSADNSKIIFCSKRDGGNFEIYIMNPDGSNQTRITNTGTNEEWAHLSPDMSTIVYGAGNFPNYKVYRCDADGNNVQEIAQGAIPKWSRDGNKIAHNKLTFINEIFEGDFYVINPDGTDPSRITNSPEGKVSENPYWSPEGTRFVFQSNITGNFQIYIIDTTGNNQTRVTNHGGNDYWPSWGRVKVPLKKYLGQTPPDSIPERFPPSSLLSDGTWHWHGPPIFSHDQMDMYFVKYILSTDKMEMYSMKIVNGDWTSPERPDFVSTECDNSPFLTPDGERLFFISNRDGNAKLYQVTRTGTGWSDPQLGAMDYSSLPGRLGWFFSMTRNNTIYFEIFEEGDQNLYRSELVDGEYSTFKKLPDEINSSSGDLRPCIDIDEQYLIFASNRPGGYGSFDLYISFRNSDGTWTEAQNLGNKINGTPAEDMACVSPEGKYLFFESARSGDLGVNTYWVDAEIIEKFRPHISDTDTISVDIRSGWNMISLPIDSIYLTSDLGPSPISEAFYYEPDSEKYIVKDTLECGEGYWLKYSSDGIMKLFADSTLADTFNVKDGWNMIGSISYPMPVEVITSDPPGMITSEFFTYRSGYVTSDTIVPGVGYWIKVNQEGKLILSAQEGLRLSNRINIISDNELPPQPPEIISSLDGKINPNECRLYQNYPNPFNPVTRFRYDVSWLAEVQIGIYDMLGQKIRAISNGEISPGSYEVEWNGTDEEGMLVPTGIYFIRMTTDYFMATQKVVVIR